MNWGMLDTFAAYIALAASSISVLIAWVSKIKDTTNSQISELKEEMVQIRSFRDKLEGADWLMRLRDLESRQRDSETQMARVEQRLESIDGLLSQILNNVQTLMERGRTDA